MSTVICDECEKYIHDREEMRVIFEESCGMTKQDGDYEELVSYCLDCFELNFSVARFAKLSSKYVFTHNCCMCDLKINTKKEKHYFIRVSNSKMYLDCCYCKECYSKDIG